jgi:transcriptional regulator with XRE-family HTH domain
VPVTQVPQFDPDALCRARRKAGLSREQLAVAAETSFDQVRRYERGQAVPSFNYALRIAAALGVGVSALATDEAA